MAYALFTHRKLYYTNMINDLNSKLDNIMQKKQNLLNFEGSIADGMITPEELASDPVNFANYSEFLSGAEEYLNKSDDEGGCATTVGEIGIFTSNSRNVK